MGLESNQQAVGYSHNNCTNLSYRHVTVEGFKVFSIDDCFSPVVCRVPTCQYLNARVSMILCESCTVVYNALSYLEDTILKQTIGSSHSFCGIPFSVMSHQEIKCKSCAIDVSTGAWHSRENCSLHCN